MLGDLEARVMRAVWDLRGAVPARAVYERVAQSHDVQLLTVITVLNKLVSKRLLTRAKRDDLLHYQARWTEDEFLVHASRRVVKGVLSLSRDVMAASFVDVLAEQDPKRLEELARLIRRRLKERETGE